METWTGTEVFITKSFAYNYYKKLGFSKEDVDKKIEEDEIGIGMPELKKRYFKVHNCQLFHGIDFSTNGEGRYVIKQYFKE